MNPVVFAMRRPFTVMVAMVAIVLGAILALRRMPVDIFPDLNTPVIYVAQPYGGMDPAQMEGFLTYYYEYHFLYISGIHHVESKNIQGVALMKLVFHPGTNMAQAMAETVAYVNRSRSFMPPGTVPPFIMRHDAGSVPVGFLVFSSETKTITQIQDEALNRVRPMFASLPGVSAPPPFGGNQRTIVISVKPQDLLRYSLSAEDVASALAAGNQISPSGSVTVGDKAPIVPVNSVVTNPKELEKIPLRTKGIAQVRLGDVAKIEDAADVATGYALVDGRRSVYIVVTKRADASTLAVVNEVRSNLPRMQSVLPPDIQVSFQFDQSPYVTRALWGLTLEGLLGAVLTGLMVLVFLHDWRSVIVVVLNIPLALLGAVVALWLTGQTVNLMSLGGLALSVGILVDEATVMVESIHTHMGQEGSLARAVKVAGAETAIPRLLAMLCILAVFIPSFFMEGAAQALFKPLTLAVGFAMVTSYFLSSTFVPVLSTWLLRHAQPPGTHAQQGEALGWFGRLRELYAGGLRGLLGLRWLIIPAYVAVTGLFVFWWWLGHPGLGMEIFPAVDAGQFQLRLQAPEGTTIDRTEQITQKVLATIADEVGAKNVAKSVCLIGTASYNYPINSIHVWTAGPQEAILRVAFKPGSGVAVGPLRERIRQRLSSLQEMQGTRLSFLAGDIVEEVMSFGSPTRLEIAVGGPNLQRNREFADKIQARLAQIPSLRDLQFAQGLEYPTVQIVVDRERAGFSGVKATDVGRAVAPITLSSRFTMPNYWLDPAKGIAYQVQVQVAPDQITSTEQLARLPVKYVDGKPLLVRDVARIQHGTMPGEYDRYNMRRLVSITANVEGEDLGRVADKVAQALKDVGDPPAGMEVDVRGQIVPLRQIFGGLAGGSGSDGLWQRLSAVFSGLSGGLLMAVVVILLLLTGNFQSLRLALIVVSTVPAVIIGVVAALVVTRTTLNIQSFMGAIMAVGVAVANAILLVTFAERSRRAGQSSLAAAVDGARTRLRAILMTSCAMIAGMAPMALALGEGGEQTAPLARAVIGGLAAATLATLVVLPAVFAVVQGRAHTRSASIDPDDPHSAHYEGDATPRTA